MKKVALFVEGQTEQIFAQKLIEQLITPRKVTTNSFKLTGGAKKPRMAKILTTQSVTQHNYLHIWTVYFPDSIQSNKIFVFHASSKY